MKIKICAVCGRVINEDEDTVYTINEGTDREYIECEQCHDQEWEVNAITNCECCGRWFSTDILQSEEVAPGHTFCPCPVCSKDVVDGLTKRANRMRPISWRKNLMSCPISLAGAMFGKPH